MLSLNDSVDAGLNRSRGGDELSRLLRTLTEDKSDRQSLIKRKNKKKNKNPDQEISPGVRREVGEIETLDEIENTSDDEYSDTNYTVGEETKKYQ